jgi:osmotically inducible protein OsmC
MVTRNATAEWNGGLKDGKGQIELGSGAWSGPYSFRTRFENEPGTNPEELIGAAHAGCFSMAFAAALGEAGYPPRMIRTHADVQLAKEQQGGGFFIDHVRLKMQANVPGIGEEDFKRIAEQAKESCPVSKALAGTNITLEPRLLA